MKPSPRSDLQRLAGEDQVRIAGPDALLIDLPKPGDLLCGCGRCGARAELPFCDPPERVAGAHRVARGLIRCDVDDVSRAAGADRIPFDSARSTTSAADAILLRVASARAGRSI